MKIILHEPVNNQINVCVVFLEWEGREICAGFQEAVERETENGLLLVVFLYFRLHWHFDVISMNGKGVDNESYDWFYEKQSSSISWKSE